MELFLVGFYKKLYKIVFQIHFLRKRLNNQMAAVVLQVIPTFCAKVSKNSLLISAETYEKKLYCIARHDVKMCFSLKCRFHVLLLGNVESCYRNWTQCLSHISTRTALKHGSNIVSVEKLLSRLVKCSIMCEEQSILIIKREEWTECLASWKRNSWGEV